MDLRLFAALIIVIIQGYLAGVAVEAARQVNAYQAEIGEPVTCERVEEDPVITDYYLPDRPLRGGLLFIAFFWVVLLLPLNVFAFMVLAPQLRILWQRRLFVIVNAIILFTILINLRAIGLARCAVAV